MGDKDSSLTRVVPVFDQLVELDPTGAAWLHQLLRLGSRSAAAEIPDDLALAGKKLPRRWGKNEIRLPAPKGLLKKLVYHIKEKDVLASGDTGEAYRRRLLMARKDIDTMEKALEAINKGERGRKWFILEGESAPDAYIETDQIVLVVEGKRTESSTTTKTKWMPKRSQLIRHMDAAWAKTGERKQVFGLLLVEGESPDPSMVPDRWVQADLEQTEDEMLKASLPHRTPRQREQFRAGVLGTATWQRVCDDFGLPWPPDRPEANP